MIKLKFITEQGLRELSANIHVYIEYLLLGTNEKLVEILEENGYIKESKIEFEEFELDMTFDKELTGTNERYYKSDTKNVKIFYNNLGSVLTPIDAVDPRVYGGLAIINFWKYVHFRYAKQIADAREAFEKGALKEKDQKLILGLFVGKTHGMRRNAFVHCLSRLYLAGSMLSDKSCEENPLWVVDELFNTGLPGKMTQLSSYNSLMVKDVCLGIMDTIMYLKNRGYEIERDKDFKGNYEFIDKLGGTMLLDYFTREEIKNTLLQHRYKLINN